MKKQSPQIEDIIAKLISHIRLRENELKKGESELWVKIDRQITPKKQTSIWPRLFWATTAVAAAAIVGIIWISTNFEKPEPDMLEYYATLYENTPVTDDIQVVVTSEDTISIKDNGQIISYSQEGSVKINEEERVKETRKDEKTEFNQIVVPFGKQTCLVLSDGSMMHINSGTRVVYPRVFHSDYREIYVEGEVFLEVKRKENSPFIVKTSDFSIEVLGTSFNVKAYKEEERGEVVLVNGSVRLTDNSKRQKVMNPSELIAINGGKAGEAISVNTANYISWIKGLLMLHPLEPLSSICKKLHRFYGVPIYISAAAGSLTMEGTIDLHHSLDDLITILASTAPLEITKGDSGYYIDKK